jgi:hypothetical protein
MLAADAPYWLTDRAVTATSASKRQLRQQLNSQNATLATANLRRCVQTAVEAPSDEMTTSKVVVVFTDGYAHGWRDVEDWRSLRRSLDGAAIATSVQVIDVVQPEEDVENADVSNLAVDSVTVSRNLVGSGESFTLSARVTNHGGSRSPATQLQWTLGDETASQSSVPPLTAGQSTDITSEQQLSDRGSHLISCQLDYDDALAGDNTAHVVVSVVDEAPVLFVQSAEDADAIPTPLTFLLASLGRDETGGSGGDSSGQNWHSVFTPTFATPEELSGDQLAGFRAVVISNPGEVSVEVISQLEEFVRDGGGVWVALGDRARPEVFNARWYDEGLGLSPQPIDAAVGDVDERDHFVLLHPPEGEHPATTILGDTQRLDIQDAKIYRRLPFQDVDDGEAVSVLLETAQGQPLAIEHYSGHGRVIVQGVPFDVGWTNLPLCEVFVPMVQEWLWYLVEPTAVRHNLEVADVLVVRPRDTTVAVDAADAAVLDLPSGEQVSMVATSDDLGPLYRFSRTAFPGVYMVRLGGGDDGMSFPYVVGRDPAESSLTLLGDTQRTQLEQLAGVRFVADVWDDPHVSALPIRREPVWGTLLVVLLVLFASESIVVTWLAWRRRDMAPAPQT